MTHEFYRMTPGDVYVDEFGTEYVLTGFWEGQTVICLASATSDERLTFGTAGITAGRFKKAGRNIHGLGGDDETAC